MESNKKQPFGMLEMFYILISYTLLHTKCFNTYCIFSDSCKYCAAQVGYVLFSLNNEKPEAQRSEITCTVSHTWQGIL